MQVMGVWGFVVLFFLFVRVPEILHNKKED